MEAPGPQAEAPEYFHQISTWQRHPRGRAQRKQRVAQPGRECIAARLDQARVTRGGGSGAQHLQTVQDEQRWHACHGLSHLLHHKQQA